MKSFICTLGALFAALATCVAAPTDAAEGLEARKKAFDCKDKLVVLVFSKYSSLASVFCSSYVPATTTTEVVVSTTIPTPPTQITTTVPLTATITETSTVTIPGSPITYYYNAPFPSNTKTILPTPPSMAKRSAVPEPAKTDKGLPPWVRDYASKEISSACSCFSITPSTKTVTSTSLTVAPTPTITATVSETVTTTTVTETTTVEGPRPTVSTCADYQSSPLNKDYSWLSPSELILWSVQDTFGLTLIECCNKCYTTPNCISYRYFGTGRYVYGCSVYTLPGNGAMGNTKPGPQLVGYNQQCPLGIYKGTRQLNSGPNQPQLAIGPCLDANYLN